jgi:SulP family sulfate permease
LFNLKNYTTSNIKNEVLSGSVVAIALVPEAIAFSIIAGVSPIVGLHTAFILGLITALIGGRPGMISGATGAIAVVLVSLVMNHGYEYMLFATLLAGCLQILVGAFKLGKFIRLVPQPAMYGFVNGLAIVITMAQFPLFENEGGLCMLLSHLLWRRCILRLKRQKFFPHRLSQLFLFLHSLFSLILTRKELEIWQISAVLSLHFIFRKFLGI